MAVSVPTSKKSKTQIATPHLNSISEPVLFICISTEIMLMQTYYKFCNRCLPNDSSKAVPKMSLANTADPVQTPHNVASDQRLQCLLREIFHQK